MLTYPGLFVLHALYNMLKANVNLYLLLFVLSENMQVEKDIVVCGRKGTR